MRSLCAGVGSVLVAIVLAVWVPATAHAAAAPVTDFAPGAASSGNRSVAVITPPPDGRIYYDWWDLGGADHGWTEVPGGGRSSAAPAASLVANGTYLFILVRGLDGTIYVNQGTPGGSFAGWQPMGISTVVETGAGASASGNRTAAAVAGPDGRIYYTWWDLGGGAHAWTLIAGGLYTDRNPAVSLVAGNYLFVMARSGLDAYLYLNQGTVGGSLVGWASTGMRTNAGPGASSSGNRTLVTAVDGYERIYYDWWDLGSGGHGWREVPGGGQTTTAVAAALVANGGYVFLLARGLDGHIYVNQGTPGGAFTGWAAM